MLKDFSEFKLTKHNHETNLVQPCNVLAKSKSNLTTNEQTDWCDDFSVIDHAESMIPGRFHCLYVGRKDELLATHHTLFAALSAFLDTQAALVKKHTPDKLIDGASKDPPTPKDL